MAGNARRSEVRALSPGYELRDSQDGGPTMFGHFAVFDRWAEINSWFEGHFLERIAPGAFRKTIRENRERIRALFQHGQDPQIGDKPLGPIEDLREDETGVYYEVPLLEADYVRESVLPGLKAGLYGSSFRFEVLRDEMDEEPGASEHNPRGLPERTLKEVRLFEFGPVTFPAYAEATADVRSLTDHFLFWEIARDPDRVRSLLTVSLERDAAPADSDAGASTSDQARRDSRDYLRDEEVSWRL